jgi:hypothetical protein
MGADPRCTSTTTATRPSTWWTGSSSSSSATRIEAGPGDFVFGPSGVPHAYVVRSAQAELLASFATARMDRFFEEVGGVPVVPGAAAPAPFYPDPEKFARDAGTWGVEIVGPPLVL